MITINNIIDIKIKKFYLSSLSLSHSTGGDDYVPKSNVSVSLSEEQSSQEGLVIIIDDEGFEGEVNEWFGVQLSLVSGSYDGRVAIETSTLEIQIEDNDPRRGNQ